MQHSDIPLKPLVAKVNQEQLPINRTYFFERPNGTRVVAEDKEAWSLYSRIPQVLGIRTYPFKFLGSSDGRKYQQAILESKEILATTGDLEKAQVRLRLGEEEEFEQAKGVMVPPPNMDRMDLKGRGNNFI